VDSSSRSRSREHRSAAGLVVDRSRELLKEGARVSLRDVVKTVVGLVDKVVKPLEPVVSFERYLGESGDGGVTYAAAVPLHAIVEWKSAQVRTPTGVLTVSRTSVLFLNIAELSAATAGEGVDDLDRITLPDGTSGPILDLGGFIDAGTGHPFATEAFLG
jgi:hypothetical protein